MKPVERGTVIGRLFESGLTYPDIAETLGLSRDQVAAFVRKTPEYQDHRRLRAERLAEVLDLHSQGLVRGQIAQATGLTATTVSGLLEPYGIGHGARSIPRSRIVAAWKQYKEEGMSMRVLTERYMVGGNTLRRLFLKHYGKEYKEIAARRKRDNAAGLARARRGG